MNRLAGLACLLVTAGACFAQSGGPDKDITQLVLGEYTFQKVHVEQDDNWIIRVIRDGKVVRTFGDTTESQGLTMNLVQMLGPSRQILLEEYSGGAHCCSTFWIVDAAPDLRVLLDTSEASMHGRSEPKDIDGDGNSEIWIPDTTFDYFRGPYAWSPVASICFSFDKHSQHFIPANDLCFPDIRLELEKDIAEVASEKWKKEDLDIQQFERLRSVLSVVIDYLYAGYDREAWDFYDKYYQVAEHDEVKVDFLDAVNHDPFYHQMHDRYQRAPAR